MNKRWARIFLAVMTAVCLVGAWRMPQTLHITTDTLCYAYCETYDGRWHLHNSTWSDAQMNSLCTLLRATELRQTLLSEGYHVGDTIYDCIITAEPDLLHETRIRLFRVDGRIRGYAEVYGGRSYRILDPEPLLEFLENEVEFE